MSGRRAFFAALTLVFVVSPAGAEDNGLGSFFSHLFNGRDGPPPQPQTTVRPADAGPRPSPTRKRKKVVQHDARDPAAPVASATPPPTASKFVYVLGDSLAISAADGMADDLQSHPEIGVVDRARDASGLVRDDYFDWPKAARDLVAPKEPAKDGRDAKDGKDTKDGKDAKDGKDPKAAKPDAPEKPKIDLVVVMLGINDKQQVRDGKDYVDPLTDRWKAAYAQRIQAVVAPLKAAHVPVLWVGLPPMRPDKLSPQLIVELNQMFKENAEKAGAKFLDVFDDFADQSGGFDAFGPNVDGQNVRLRGPDGIHLTAAGGKKLAHFIDVEALADLGAAPPPASDDIAALPPDIGKATDDINEQIRREVNPPADRPQGPNVAAPEAAVPAPKPPPKPEAGAIASLAAHPVSAGAALETPAAAPAGEAVEALRRGDPPPAAPGRADDFTQ